MKRILYFTIAIWLMSIYGLSAQVDTVVTSTGELGSLGGDFEFVYETGQIVSFPRLAITGEILYYAPLVTTDSVPSATISATAATVYANIVFNGWYETVSSQGFQICADGTFTSNVQTVLVIPEQSYANCTPPCAHNSFQHTFTDLTPGSTYYVRAFATNQSGTAYGSVLSFKTLAILPTISVNTSVIDVTSSSATVSNGITSDGGAMVTGRGVCWGTDHNPSLSGNHTSDGNGIGNFYSTITGLLPNTTYYVRTYATNSVGTNYGNEVSFTTPCDVVSVTINGNTNICAGTTTTLTATQGYNSYQWSGGQVSGNTTTVSQAGTYSVTVTDAYGCQNSAQVTVSVNALPTVTATANPATICAGQSATLTASGADSYSWDNSLGTGNGKQVTPATTTIYHVTGTVTTTGCTGNGQVTVTVNPTPAVPTLSANANTLCVGNNGFITVTAPTGNGCSYSINGTDFQAGTTFSGLSANTYAVTVKTAQGCINSAQATVGNSTVAPTVTATANTATICAGQSATLTASGADSYSWDNSLGTGNGKQVTPATTTIYHVTGTVSATGCTGSGQVTVTVNPTPAVPTLSANANTLCVGNNGSITVTTPTGNGCSYSINGTDFQAGTTFSGLSANTYAVTVKTAQGCTNSAQATVGNSTVTPTVAATANPASVCAGQGATLTASGADSYSWDNSLGTGNGKQVTPATTTTYHVTGTVTATGCTGSGQVTVTVTSCATVPTVTTSTASAITYNSATVAANVTSDGGATVTERGVCWSTNHNPVNTGSHSTSGSGTGSYSVNLTGLSSSTTYYVRAYAINSVGVSYGSEVSFTTAIYNTNKPVAYTNTVSVMHSTSATLSGRYSNSGPAITQVGFYYGTTPESLNSSISGNSITVNADGTFSGTISGLTSGTSYYFKAFASNANGTAYGSVKNFRTLDSETAYNQACPNARTVSDTDGNVYNTVLIGNQCWMRENLRTTRTPGGTEIPVGTNSTYNTLTSLRYYPNGDPSLVNQYGYLYNRYCATQNGISNNSPSGVQGVCPNNWHLPSNAEWETLVTYVSNQYTYAAVALASQKDWQSYTGNNTPGKNPSNNNSTGFSALPAGIYANHGDAYLQRSCFWTTTKNASGYYLQCFIIYSNSNVTTGSAHYSVHWGMSVRCIKD